ncbi:hypothetical protein O181_004833 [Austropuccinia psidii MF-1]|uniref:Uncharacterized protein n=1 Tax=Austropuccinia psidii MF-1 TaxID=1389203 RepID=A0A9Q3BHE9_9BASI|nr:hypothetical protein [Austropuccinia psidii MF-1]
MDKPSSSKLPGSIEEIHEGNLKEETVEGQEEMSSTERLQQNILEMQAELLALIKKEGKNKSSSYTPQYSPLEEQTTLPRSLRPHGSPSPYPRPMATSTPYTEQRQITLPRIFNIPSQMPPALHQEIPRNTNPIVKIREQRFPQKNQPYRPRNPLPPFSFSYHSYIPAQMTPRPQVKCPYCKEEGHSATRCTYLAEDLDRRIFRTQGASYLFPNYQRVPMEGNEISKDIVRAFAKEQAELNQKFMEKPTVKSKPGEEVKPT